MAKHYKIKLEDKAALLNHLQALNINIDSFDITDNKLNNTFEFTVEDPEIVNMINTVLRRSPKISQVKEQIKAMIREELKAIRNKE
jgi:2C-methyl-D-erythritol 2,4-cyclodiphosphate synthase